MTRKNFNTFDEDRDRGHNDDPGNDFVVTWGVCVMTGLIGSCLGFLAGVMVVTFFPVVKFLVASMVLVALVWFVMRVTWDKWGPDMVDRIVDGIVDGRPVMTWTDRPLDDKED